MQELLKKISELVDKSLGPLGSGGFTFETVRDFLVQFIATILLFFAIRFFLWKPITKLLEERRALVDKELEEVRQHKQSAENIEITLRIAHAEAKIKLREMLDKMQLDGNIEREKIIAEAKLEAARRLELAQEEIVKEIAEQKQEIKNQIVEIAFEVAQKMLGHELDEKRYLSVVHEIIESSLEEYE